MGTVLACYLCRQWKRSLLLFFCFFFSSILVLTAASLLRGAEQIQTEMKEKTGSKVILEKSGGFSAQDMQTLSSLEGLLGVNRFAEMAAIPADFASAMGSDGKGEVTLRAWDDLSSDGPFAQEQHRLQAGDDAGIVVNAGLGLAIGREISFQNSSGAIAGGQITGLYTTGSERLQPDSLSAKNRLENQIFVPMVLLEKLDTNLRYGSAAAYTADPDNTAEKIAALWPGITATTSDALLKSVTAPVRQVVQIVSLLLIVITLTVGIVLSLLLTLWMRTRIREFGIFRSMGMSVGRILAQVGLESGILWCLGACFGAACAAALLPLGMGRLFSASACSALTNVHLELAEFGLVLAGGHVLVLLCAEIAVLPCILRHPRELLSRMEE